MRPLDLGWGCGGDGGSGSVGGGGGRGGGRGRGGSGGADVCSSTNEVLVTAEHRLIFYLNPALQYGGSGGGGGSIGGVRQSLASNGFAGTANARRARKAGALDTRRSLLENDNGKGGGGGDDDDDAEGDDDDDDDDAMDVDRQLLNRGQLDLNGVTRLLDDMTENPASARVSSNLNRRVGFAA